MSEVASRARAAWFASRMVSGVLASAAAMASAKVYAEEDPTTIARQVVTCVVKGASQRLAAERGGSAVANMPAAPKRLQPESEITHEIDEIDEVAHFHVHQIIEASLAHVEAHHLTCDVIEGAIQQSSIIKQSSVINQPCIIKQPGIIKPSSIIKQSHAIKRVLVDEIVEAAFAEPACEIRSRVASSRASGEGRAATATEEEAGAYSWPRPVQLKTMSRSAHVCRATAVSVAACAPISQPSFGHQASAASPKLTSSIAIQDIRDTPMSPNDISVRVLPARKAVDAVPSWRLDENTSELAQQVVNEVMAEVTAQHVVDEVIAEVEDAISREATGAAQRAAQAAKDARSANAADASDAVDALLSAPYADEAEAEAPGLVAIIDAAGIDAHLGACKRASGIASETEGMGLLGMLEVDEVDDEDDEDDEDGWQLVHAES